MKLRGALQEATVTFHYLQIILVLTPTGICYQHVGLNNKMQEQSTHVA